MARSTRELSFFGCEARHRIDGHWQIQHRIQLRTKRPRFAGREGEAVGRIAPDFTQSIRNVKRVFCADEAASILPPWAPRVNAMERLKQPVHGIEEMASREIGSPELATDNSKFAARERKQYPALIACS
jgi:hypothetical protein